MRRTGVYSGTEVKPTSLSASRTRAAAIIEFHAHSNVDGGVAFEEMLFLGGDDIEQQITEGPWPPLFERTMPVLESFATVPGTIFQDIADLLNEAEEKHFLRLVHDVDDVMVEG